MARGLNSVAGTVAFSSRSRERAGVRDVRSGCPHPSPLPRAGEGTVRAIDWSPAQVASKSISR
ncbi:hypothetical protein [Lysobacter gummosus]|uniref:hypothetical protein n=1 Tax=Lysobacter gummosus TaxID=262324 RepID=UPI00363EB9D8